MTFPSPNGHASGGAVETARLLLDAAHIDKEITLVCDERLREKEFGILDRLTAYGIRLQYPALTEQRSHVGKFYFRPSGGERRCVPAAPKP